MRLTSCCLIIDLVFLCGVGYSESAAEEKPSTEKSGSLVIDMTASPGLNTPEQKEKWKTRQAEIWTQVADREEHLRTADDYFKTGKYQEALNEYMVAFEKSAPGYQVYGPQWGIARSYEALGDFKKALEKVNHLLTRYAPDGMAVPILRFWKEVLEAAALGHYDVAADLYRKRFAAAENWEKKSEFLEQRLRLMEERARAAVRVKGTLHKGTRHLSE